MSKLAEEWADQLMADMGYPADDHMMMHRQIVADFHAYAAQECAPFLAVAQATTDFLYAAVRDVPAPFIPTALINKYECMIDACLHPIVQARLKDA